MTGACFWPSFPLAEDYVSEAFLRCFGVHLSLGF